MLMCVQFRHLPGGRSVGGRAAAGAECGRAARARHHRARAADGAAQQPAGTHHWEP